MIPDRESVAPRGCQCILCKLADPESATCVWDILGITRKQVAALGATLVILAKILDAILPFLLK